MTDEELIAKAAGYIIEINEGRDQFGLTCRHPACGYQFHQSPRESHGWEPYEGLDFGEVPFDALIRSMIAHDEPGHGTESCARFDVDDVDYYNCLRCGAKLPVLSSCPCH